MPDATKSQPDPSPTEPKEQNTPQGTFAVLKATVCYEKKHSFPQDHHFIHIRNLEQAVPVERAALRAPRDLPLGLHEGHCVARAEEEAGFVSAPGWLFFYIE